jgi:hypothetical protein
VSAYPDNERQGKLFIAGGVAAIVSGFVLQAYAVNSVANQAPPQFFSNSGRMAGLAQVGWLLVVGGLILAVIGVIRYAQSGPDSHAVAFTPAPAGYPVAPAPASPTVVATSSAPVSTPAFCSSCGSRIVGEGRFCASCGTSTAH